MSRTGLPVDKHVNSPNVYVYENFRPGDSRQY